MKPLTQKQARIASLGKEMDAIHALNCVYWKEGEAVTAEARFEYKRRIDRLEEIRRELAQLR
jgi:hypothetical protein